MSAKEELELDVSELCLRCSVDGRNKSSERNIYSSEFRFKGGGWKLRYRYEPSSERQYNLLLRKCSGVYPNPLHVSVQVESVEKERIVRVLPEDKRFTHQFEDTTISYYIWQKSERDIVRSLPEFDLYRYRVLKFLVVLKTEDVKSQTKDIGKFRTLVSTSVQTEGLPPETAGQSSRPTASTSCQTTQLQNNPDCLESLSHDFSKLLDEGSVPDVEFQCSGQSTAAHGVVVSARSEVFASMLSSDMLEGRTRVIKIPDVEPDVFQHFLRYIYTGTLPDLTLDIALSLYEAGDRYSVMGLARRCAKFLLEHLAVDNACNVLSVADAHSDKDLKEAVVRFMVDNKVPRVSSCWPEFCGAHPILALEVVNRCYIAVTE